MEVARKLCDLESSEMWNFNYFKYVIWDLIMTWVNEMCDADACNPTNKLLDKVFHKRLLLSWNKTNNGKCTAVLKIKYNYCCYYQLKYTE